MPAFGAIDAALAVYAHTDARTAEQVFSTGNIAARRHARCRALWRLSGIPCASSRAWRPWASRRSCSASISLLEQLTLDGLRRWALLGVQSHMRDPNAQARYFTLDSEEGRQLLQAEGDQTVFPDVERRLSLYLRALVGTQHQAAAGDPYQGCELPGGAPPSTDGRSGCRSPIAALPGNRACAVSRRRRARVGSHRLYHAAFPGRQPQAAAGRAGFADRGRARRATGDARVSRAAESVEDLPCRPARRGRNLGFVDGAPGTRADRRRLSTTTIRGWSKGRRLFFEQTDYWQEQSISRALGGLLGNDMGQMRVQFNFKTYVVEPAYRDDNQGIWDFGDMGEPSPDDDDVVMQGARLADDDSNTGAERGRRRSGTSRHARRSRSS